MPTLLLLHGHGDRPETFAPIGAALVAGTDWQLRCPAGPHRLGDGSLGLAWWADDEEGPTEATLSYLLDLVAAGTPAASDAPLALVGFSQGAAMALATAAALAARRGTRALRVAVVAGFSPGDGSVAPPGSDVLVVHGDADEVVDPFHGELVARRCRRNGCTVEELRHPGAHHWDARVSAMVRTWLLR